jgi:thymidylate kinase
MADSRLSTAVQQIEQTLKMDNLLRGNANTERPALHLISKLCQALRDEGINYCHWKSNNALDRSANGENDVDLLISRADASRFSGILYQLGFKQAKAPVEKQMPGVMDYFGYDEPSNKWVHVHAHYQLIMGDDMTKNFRFAIEDQYLESTVWDGIFKVPEVEFEFIVFVIRMVLKHSTWDAIISRQGKMKTSEQKELAYLQKFSDQDRVNEILKDHLPYIHEDLFKNCVLALQKGCSIWTRIMTAYQLQTRLRANAYYPLLTDAILKLWRRAVLMIRGRIFRSSSKYQFAIGGAMIAIVGGDGAGKSTAIDILHVWLSKNFRSTKIHMGRPAWSWPTIIIRSILKIGQIIGLYPLERSFDETLEQKSLVSPGYPYLIREVCRARDRYWTYIKARQFASEGKLVILDRFPLPQIQLMDGAQTREFIHQLNSGPRSNLFLTPRPNSWLARLLVRMEENYYSQIVLPEVLAVLKLNPAVAVQRKTTEDPLSVEKRSTEIWQLNWENTEAYVVDASRSKEEVASELKTLIWSRL